MLSARPAVAVILLASTLLAAEVVMGSSNPITVAAEIAVYSSLAVLARLHARRMGAPTSSVQPVSAVCGVDGLTRREREVVALAAHGRTASEIAGLLHIGERTVETHLANAYPKLGVRSKLELVKQAHSLGV